MKIGGSIAKLPLCKSNVIIFFKLFLNDLSKLDELPGLFENYNYEVGTSQGINSRSPTIFSAPIFNDFLTLLGAGKSICPSDCLADTSTIFLKACETHPRYLGGQDCTGV